MPERDNSFNSPLQEAFSQRLSRRKFIRQSALALGSLAAAPLLRTQESSAANAFDGGVEDAVSIYNLDALFAGEIRRPKDMQHFLQTRLLPPDARLGKRNQTPITGLILNPNEEIFANLEGYKSPKNRLDKAVLKGFAYLDSVRDETERMAELQIETIEDRIASPVGEREQSMTIPEPTPEERMQELLADPNYRIPIFGYEEDAIDPKNYKLFDIDPHLGIEIEILDDRPERKPMVELFANYGFTPTVVKHRVIADGEEQNRYGLRLGIFGRDQRFIGSDFFTPQGEMDATYSMKIAQYFERAAMFYTPDFMEYYSSTAPENPWWTKMTQMPGYVYLPDVVTLTNGPLDGGGRHTTAPVLRIESPNFS